MKIPEAIQKQLDRLGLRALEFESGSTPTAVTAAEKIGVEVGQIAKSLLFKTKHGEYLMVVCAGDKRIKQALLKELAGSKCSMANAEETFSVTGCLPGGVCPYGLLEGAKPAGSPPCTLWIDESLKVWDAVYPAAGTDSSGVPTTFASLCALADGRTCNITE